MTRPSIADAARRGGAGVWLACVAGCAAGGDAPASTADPRPRAAVTQATSSPPPRPPPACLESDTTSGAWPRPRDIVRAVHAEPPRLGHLEQTLGAATPTRLRFLGTHLFDLLDKLAHEGGPSELDRRRVICAALASVAASGAPVVRLWGSLKHTGKPDEITRAAELLELVLDENGRRARPLRFVITLLNHQPGYGAPDPRASLDDQDPKSPWHARRIYLGESWKLTGHGLLADRIDALRARPGIARAPEILGWELVNELDTHRHVAGGTFQGAEAAALRDSFIFPALDRLATSFPQPILLGDLRGHRAGYAAWARALVASLPPHIRSRLVWTSHVYAKKAPSAASPELAEATWKLDLDLAIAADFGLPFVLGEIGQLVPGPAPAFCRDGAPHDLAQLFAAVLEPKPRAPLRGAIEAALFWGEGRCNLDIPGSELPRWITIGAGGDSADLGPGEGAARAALGALRRSARFQVEQPLK